MQEAATGERSTLMKRGLIALFALAAAANGIYMLAAPLAWYGDIAGVPNTGPFNPHFVRDIGVAYLTQGLLLFWAARRLALATPFLVAVAIFLGLHALLHLWDVAAERLPMDHLIIDLPGVFLPVFIALGLAYWCRGERAGVS